MGFAVNGQCYEDEQAYDVYYSSVKPVIASDGQIYQLSKHADGWYFGQHKLIAELPKCDRMQNFKDGSQIGIAILGVVVTVVCIKIVLDIFK